MNCLKDKYRTRRNKKVKTTKLKKRDNKTITVLRY